MGGRYPVKVSVNNLGRVASLQLPGQQIQGILLEG